MKKLLYLFIALSSFVTANSQSVGIGTTAPNTNAILDIFSNNKGVLIPRIVDTGTVPNPLEGMIIYNKNTKTPYYHNGQQWVSLGGRLPGGANAPTTDKITYSLCGPGFSCVEEEILSVSVGLSNPTSIGPGGITPGTTNFSSFNLMKPLDANSWGISRMAISGSKYSSIEIKFYALGQLTPYISYKFNVIIFESYQISGSSGGGSMFESVSIAYETYGFKDWEHNLSYSYSLITKTFGAY